MKEYDAQLSVTEITLVFVYNIDDRILKIQKHSHTEIYVLTYIYFSSIKKFKAFYEV